MFIQTDSIQHPILEAKGVQLDLLRLDMHHPYISGNKWFKLKYNMEAAKQEGFTTVISVGGAYSNHLHALAFAAYKHNLCCIGIVRGEEVNNPTIIDCRKWGMEIRFVSRKVYTDMREQEFQEKLLQEFPQAYFIPEGGSNERGIKGCSEILNHCNLNLYHFVSCSVGTGTTLIGLRRTMPDEIKLLGFTAMKNGEYLASFLLPLMGSKQFGLRTQYHFGGFGKLNSEVSSFMQSFQNEQGIELDRVYTAKMMMGLLKDTELGYFSRGEKILAIHTGGLQGNRSMEF